MFKSLLIIALFETLKPVPRPATVNVLPIETLPTFEPTVPTVRLFATERSLPIRALLEVCNTVPGPVSNSELLPERVKVPFDLVKLLDDKLFKSIADKLV